MLYIASPDGGMNESPSFLTWLLKIKKNKPYKKKANIQKIIDIIHPQMRLKKKELFLSMIHSVAKFYACYVVILMNYLVNERLFIIHTYS